MSQLVPRQQLAEVIGEKTLHLTDRNKLIKAVSGYLAAEHRSINLDSLMRDIMQYRLNQGMVEVIVISAHELNNQVISDIKALLKEHFPHSKEILIDNKIDSTLVGGVRLELPQETLDLSVRSKLNQFKRLVAGGAN